MLRYRFLPYLLSFSLSLGGGMSKNQEIMNKPYSKMIEVTNDELVNSYIRHFDSFPVSYNRPDLYITEAEVLDLINESKTKQDCNYRYDGETNKLVDKIINNSEEFIKEHPDFSLFPTTYISMLIKSIVHMELNSNDIDEDFCNLKSTAIVCGDANNNSTLGSKNYIVYSEDSSIILGYYNTGFNVIVLDFEAIKNSVENDQTIFEEKLFSTLSHELNHVRQYICPCREDAGQTFKTVHNKFIIESSAESFSYFNDNALYQKEKSSYDYNYFFEREYEAILFLFALCRDNIDINDYYNAIFDTDLENLYNFFGANTQQEILDFYQIMYSIDAALALNKFPFEYYDKEIVNLNESKKAVGYQYRVAIFREVIQNMLQYTANHPEFSFEENITIFNIVKNNIVYDAYDFEKDGDNAIYTYDDNFVQMVYQMNEDYTSFLSQYYNLPKENIREYEKNDVLFTIASINSICKDGIDLNGHNHVLALQLVNKFPDLKMIFFTKYTNIYAYQDFLKHNNLVSRKLSR